MTRPVVLVVLDGFGLAASGPGNAVALAATPHFDRLWATVPRTQLVASGEAVGLPEGQMGNSEVGHLNLGAGRVVPQSLAFITAQFTSGAMRSNPVLVTLAEGVRARRGTLHLLGLVSDGGVHADLHHLLSLIDTFAQLGVPRLAIHAFTDGRDTAPDSALGFMTTLQEAVKRTPTPAQVATVIGRYHAMDRDRRWDRTQRAWDAMVHGRAGEVAPTAVAAVEAAYARGESDEFITPTRIEGGARIHDGARIQDGDAVFMFNFRADRARQLLHAFVDPEPWDGFERGKVPKVALASLMQLDAAVDAPFALALPPLRMPLAEVIADAGLTQFHAAETEKYPHVTYFFNAKREHPYPGEVRHLEPSPKVATYDLQPEMSALPLARACVERLREHDDAFALINFANPDMVGHTGDLAATVRACETTDHALGMVLDAVAARAGVALVVADHGNAEQMLADGGGVHTAHTTNPVPCLLVGAPAGVGLRDGGVLGDVAPTVLELLGLNQPPEMTGRSLLTRSR
jgi:2,3-bisphosphoglycerate-independent phosphoglycerate mutase